MAITGLDCKMYRSEALATDNTSVAFAAMTWIEVSDVRDLTVDLTAGEADVSIRGNTWRQTITTLLDGGATFDMVWESADAGVEAIRDAFLGRAPIALAFLDGDEDTPATQGLAGNFSVSGFSHNQPLEDGVTVSVTVKTATFNGWYTVPAP